MANQTLVRVEVESVCDIPIVKALKEADKDRELENTGVSNDIKVSSTRLTVANLSGGQRQSIAIGRAASFEPRVLILDEPTSALAVAEVEAVLRLIKRVADRGVSVILITHRLQDIFRVCDRVMVMYEGTNVAERAIDDTNLDDLVMLIVGGEAAAARVSA